MKAAKTLFDRAAEAGKTKKPYLQLGEKLEDGGVRSTGKHIVTIVSGKLGKGTDPFTNEPREEFQVVVDEKGIEKLWNIPVKDKQGNLHYLIQKLAEIEEGSVISLEMKRKGVKNYIELLNTDEKVGEIPSVQVDEGGEEPDGDVAGGKDVSVEDLPF